MRATRRICQRELFKRYTYEGTLQHPRYVVEQLNILALNHIYKNEFDLSEVNLKKALKISTYHTNQVDGAWTPTLLVWTLNSLAKLEQAKQNLAEALNYVVQAHEATQHAYEAKVLPVNAVIATAARLGEIHYDLGNLDEAGAVFANVIALEKSREKREQEVCSPNTAHALLYLGKIALARQNFAEAKELLEKSWAIYRDVAGILNVQVFTVLSELGKAYAGVGDHARARTLLEYAGQGFEFFLYDEKRAESVHETWKEVISHLPGVEAPRPHGPHSHRNGIDIYPVGESPEEELRRKQKAADKKQLLARWKKQHGIAKYESNE